MIVSILKLVILTSTVSFSSINGVNGSPKFDSKKASKSAADLETTIELTIAVTNLKFAFAWFARPLCVTSTRPVNGRAWTEYHSTETIPWSRNLTFTSKVRIPYLLKDKQELMFEVYTQTGYDNHPSLDVLFKGYATCKVADLVSAGKLTIPMRDINEKETSYFGARVGDVVVYAEKLGNQYNKVTLKLRSEYMDKNSAGGEPNHYIEIHKRFMGEKEVPTTQDDYLIVYRTEEKENRQEEWEPISIPFSTLCSGDRTRELKFVCRDRKHNLMGEFKTTVEEVQEHKTEFELSNEKSRAAGRISISDFFIDPVHTFAEFMLAGLEIHLTIAIDFTKRSGLFENPKSFHYRGGGENKCEKAIRFVGNAFKDYVSNDKYAIRGFGARKEDDVSTILDDFPLNADMDSVEGVEGAIQSYRGALADKSIQIGPEAHLAPTIRKFGYRIAVNTSSSKSYCVLVVVVMGDIDVDARTRRAINDVVSGKALSIIFVSIGETDLTGVIYKTASYTSLLNHFHSVFVHESDLQDGDDSINAYRSTELLAKLPEQVVSYMNSKGLKPRSLQ